LRNFRAHVNGQVADVDIAESITSFRDLKTGKPTDPEQVVESWFIWSAKFKRGDTTLIENWYTGEWGGTYATKMFYYGIGTGTTWDSTIGDGRIVFDHSALASAAFVARYADSASIYPVQTAKYSDSTVYHFRDLRPEPHDALYIHIVSFWDDPLAGKMPASFDSVYLAPAGLSYFMRDKRKQGLDLRLMRNEIFARHGYQFKDSQLQKHFEQAGWYAPDPQFTFNKLNRYERATVNVIAAIEKGEN
jgi:hypothetical protein